MATSVREIRGSKVISGLQIELKGSGKSAFCHYLSVVSN